MTFERWLKDQRKRQDPIGDLARDFYYSKKIDGNKDKCNETHLSRFNANTAVYDALHCAREEWKSLCGQS